MKKAVINIAIILAVFAIAWYAKGHISPTVVDRTVTDTVTVNKPYFVEKIVEKEVPIRITEYKTKYDTIETVKIEHDTVFVDTNLDTFTYNSRFLTAYPLAPRFLGLQFANHELELTYQSTDGEVQGKTWNTPQGYRVGLDNGEPNIETFDEPKDRFNHYIEGGYIRNYSYSSPYLLYSAEYFILGIDVKGTINANQQPFGMVGIKYDL